MAAALMPDTSANDNATAEWLASILGASNTDAVSHIKRALERVRIDERQRVVLGIQDFLEKCAAADQSPVWLAMEVRSEWGVT